jgi:hypothetical protein
MNDRFPNGGKPCPSSGRKRQEGNGRVFIIKLRPLPNVDAVKALRRGLKYLLRHCGLRCISIEEKDQ